MNAEQIYESISDISDDYITEAGAIVSGKKPAPRKRKTLILIAAILAVLLSACTIVYVATDWDEALVDRFHPSDVTITQLQSAVQDVNVSSQCGDVLLTVRQAIGDSNTFYTVLDVTLPDDIDLSDYLPQDYLPDDYDVRDIGAYDTFWYINRSANYDDIRGMTFEQAQSFLDEGSDVLLSSTWGGGLQGVDFETNTLTFLLNFTSGTKDVSGKPVTLLIERLVFWNGSEEIPVIDGPFLISWPADFNGTRYSFEITDGDISYGTVSLSAFSLYAKLYITDYDSWHDFVQTISITLKDGQTFRPMGSSGGSYSGNPGNAGVSYTSVFTHILDLDQVASIQVGDYTIPIS